MHPTHQHGAARPIKIRREVVKRRRAFHSKVSENTWWTPHSKNERAVDNNASRQWHRSLHRGKPAAACTSCPQISDLRPLLAHIAGLPRAPRHRPWLRGRLDAGRAAAGNIQTPSGRKLQLTAAPRYLAAWFSDSLAATAIGKLCFPWRGAPAASKPKRQR